MSLKMGVGFVLATSAFFGVATMQWKWNARAQEESKGLVIDRFLVSVDDGENGSSSDEGAEPSDSIEQLEERCHELVERTFEARDRHDFAAANEFKGELAQLTATIFDKKEAARLAQIELLEKHLNELKEFAQLRQAKKDEIVDRRVLQLLGRPDPLDWDASSPNEMDDAEGEGGPGAHDETPMDESNDGDASDDGDGGDDGRDGADDQGEEAANDQDDDHAAMQPAETSLWLFWRDVSPRDVLIDDEFVFNGSDLMQPERNVHVERNFDAAQSLEGLPGVRVDAGNHVLEASWVVDGKLLRLKYSFGVIDGQAIAIALHPNDTTELQRLDRSEEDSGTENDVAEMEDDAEGHDEPDDEPTES